MRAGVCGGGGGWSRMVRGGGSWLGPRCSPGIKAEPFVCVGASSPDVPGPSQGPWGEEVVIVQDDLGEAKFTINKGPAVQLLFLCMSQHIVGGESGSSPKSRSGTGYGCFSQGESAQTSGCQELEQDGFPDSPFPAPLTMSTPTLLQDPGEQARILLSPKGQFPVLSLVRSVLSVLSICPFIYSTNTLRTYYVPDTVLGTEETDE